MGVKRVLMVAVAAVVIIQSVLLPVAKASTAPVVATGITSVPIGAAPVLNGYLTSLGTASSVAVSFEYGMTADYGSSTVPQSLLTPGSFSAAVPGLTPGTYYHFRAKATGDGTVYGPDAGFFTHYRGADLIISFVSGVWADPSNTAYNFNFRVKNIGDYAAPAGFAVGMTKNGEAAQPKIINVALDAGQTYDGVFAGVAYIGPGHDTIMVTADVNGIVPELNENNNALTGTWLGTGGELPDLVINEMHETLIPPVEGRYSIGFTVRNVGAAPSDTFHIGLRIDGVLQERLIFPAYSLAPNAQMNLAFDNWPSYYTVDGLLDSIELVADIDNEVAESNDLNNTLLNNFYRPLPDLAFVETYEQWTDETHAAYTVYFTVQNNGAAAAPDGSLVGVTINGVPAVEHIAIPIPLHQSEQWSGSFTTAFPFTGPGPDTIVVNLDVGNALVESNEGNNSWTKTFPPPPPPPSTPDLIVLGQNEVWYPGAEGVGYLINFTVQNIGATVANPTNVGVKIDGAFRPETYYVPTLQPGEAFSALYQYVYWLEDDWGNWVEYRDDIVIPISGASDDIEVVADYGNAVTEVDETNNSMTNTITPQMATITLYTPNANENWPVFTSHNIIWASSNVTGGVNIDVSRDGGVTWENLFENASNDGSQPWVVTGPPTTQARIRVYSVVNPAVIAVNNGDFTISPAPSITVTSPAGGEKWVIGTAHNVTWTSVNVTGNVGIQVSRNGGGTWEPGFGVANNGTAVLTITGPETTQARIKIWSVTNSGIFGASDSDFAIVALAPPAVATVSANVLSGTTADLYGNLTAPGSATDVQVSFEYGTTADYGTSTAVQTTSVSGIFSARLTGLTPSTLYHFRARAAGDGTVFGDDITFTMPQPQYTLVMAVNGMGVTAPPVGPHIYTGSGVVQVSAAAGSGWQFVNWTGPVANPTAPVTSVNVSGDVTVTANFVPIYVPDIGDILQSPQTYSGLLVTVSGLYRGWESGHGSPPVTRNDWVVLDSTGAIYVTGNTLGFRFPGDLGKQVTLTGTVRLKNGQPYLEIAR